MIDRKKNIAELCRTPHGVRELKSVAPVAAIMVSGRTPHGVRELKLIKLT